MSGKQSKIQLFTGIVHFTFFLVAVLEPLAEAGSGCKDATRESFLKFNSVAACKGYWFGHVWNASNLCALGWTVCSWKDQAMLRNLTWEDAVLLDGCFAYNAAQDGGRCRACRNHLDQDDLAGIGRSCPHQNQGQTSCITGGRIDASCCVDSHFHRACQYQPGVATGVLCCRLPARPPKIIVRPPEKISVYTGLIFLLTCQASGIPPPRVHWYKNGKQLPRNNSRFSILTSGDLLVTLPQPWDSGLYSCEVINKEGVDMASSFVTLKEYHSGCSDRTTEGLHTYKDIHACEGKWEGHVKRARHLCARSWVVCSPRDAEALQELSWSDVFELPGCYAYNAANKKGKCTRCHKEKMAGFGRHCARLRYLKSSCLSQGRIDVYHPRRINSCSYKQGFTTGVLCCKKKKGKQVDQQDCHPPCENGGHCIASNRCKCQKGYKGAMCQNPICIPQCGNTSVCVKPNNCRCKPRFTGRNCKQKHGCKLPCFNGGRCKKGKCVCPPTHWGRSCQYCGQKRLA